MCPDGAFPDIEVGASLPDGPEADAVGAIRDVIRPGELKYSEFQSFTNGGTNWLGTARLVEEVEELYNYIVSDPKYAVLEVTVTEMYTQPATDVTSDTVTYFNAGRAVALSVALQSGEQFDATELSLVSDLIRLMSANGFGYVNRTGTTSIYGSVGVLECTSPLDIVFLLDASGSIETRPDGFPGYFNSRVVGFVRAVAAAFDVGQTDNQTRIAVASFAGCGLTFCQSDADFAFRVNFNLNESPSNEDVDDVLEAGLEYNEYGFTFTPTAIDNVRTEVLYLG